MVAFTPIVPYPSQSECLGILRFVRSSGTKKALVVKASGLGKTITAALHVRERLIEKPESRHLFLCHQNDILEQAQGEFGKVIGSNVSFGYYHGDEKSAGAQIVFASFQTMRNNLSEFKPDEFDTIVVDETHRVRAKTFEKVVRHFKPDFLLGITATPDRMDEQDIRDIYGKEVYNLPLPEALARRMLSDVDYRIRTDEIGSREVLDTPNGRLSMKLLNRKIFIPKRDEEIAKIVMEEMAVTENPKVIVYCSSVKHCERMAKAIPGAVPIHSRLNKNDRRTRLEFFRQGLFQVAVTVDMFNEALDIPQANIIVFLRSTSSKTIFFQQLGRGLRPHAGKSKVVILDFVGNCERIRYVYELWQRIRQESDRQRNFGGERMEMGARSGANEPFTLNVDAVEFKERVLPLIDLINRLSADFYTTWQEASAAAQELGIKKQVEYKNQQGYKKDIRLPSTPECFYPDFPGWRKFLGTVVKRYERWQEAGEAALASGIDNQRDYWKNWRKDPLLPSHPELYYKDFPGWTEFFKKDRGYYKTLNELRDACEAYGVDTSAKYGEARKKDPKLPSHPELHYEDWPGWAEFFSRPSPFYGTWQEASRACLAKSITSSLDYRRKKAYRLDERLPAHPESVYPDFPGWPKFFGR